MTVLLKIRVLGIIKTLPSWLLGRGRLLKKPHQLDSYLCGKVGLALLFIRAGFKGPFQVGSGSPGLLRK